MDSIPRAVLTPCTGVCTLDADGFCHGCLRTGQEIGDWLQLGDAERARIMDVVLPAREARRS
ncbi:DUF1289 domain-containing protein [Luteimonas cellulosilyticus]|uniref:DUF1289 domain-containing protein n=1 Tax=Luteimonas cellulosilyticus TaxID=2683586 RepID=UPI001F18EF38|nr:DUF1289 domain-containing protein [Luteimonas cellulosilyticus]